MGKIKITNEAEPATPASGTSEVYVDSTSKKLSTKDDTGTVTEYGAGGGGTSDHTALTNIGTNTHAQIDTHIADTTNPHSVDIDDVTPTTTKGDLIIEDGSNAIRVGVGTNDQVLVADSGEASGVKWGTVSGTISTVCGIENPVDTHWKIRRNEFTQGDGNNFWGELPMRGLASTGAVVAETALASGEEHRVGIVTVGGGTTYGMLIGYESDTRFGDGDHRIGFGFKPVNIPDATDDSVYAFGYSMDTNSLGTYMTYIGIDRTVSTTNYIAASVRAGTRTTTDTGVAFVAGTWHTFEVIVNADNTSHGYYIDGNLVATHTTNMPDASLSPMCGVFSVAGAARSFEIDWMYQAFRPATVRGVITDWITDDSIGLTETQVVGKAWNPVSTDWRLYYGDCFGAIATSTLGYPDGNMGLQFFYTGTGSSRAHSTSSYANRAGILNLGCGTSAGASASLVSSNYKNTIRYGDARIKVGTAVKIIDLPTATEDYEFFFGLTNNVTHVFATEATGLHLDYGVNTTNWLAHSNGSAATVDVDTGIAFSTNWVNLEVDIAQDLSSIKYYIDGVLAHTETTANNIPAAGSPAGFSIATRTTAATQVNHFEIDWYYMAVKESAARGTITTWIDEL